MHINSIDMDSFCICFIRVGMAHEKVWLFLRVFFETIRKFGSPKCLPKLVNVMFESAIHLNNKLRTIRIWLTRSRVFALRAFHFHCLNMVKLGTNHTNILNLKTMKYIHLLIILPIADLRTAFDLLDRNQDGRVTANELQFMLRNLGIHVRDELIVDLITEASPSGKTHHYRSRFRFEHLLISFPCSAHRYRQNQHSRLN